MYTAVIAKDSTKYGFKRVVDALYTFGISSVFFIVCIALFVGFILGLQGYYTLTRFGAETLLGNAVAGTLVQELAPVFTAIMLIARVGSGITSHLAVMRMNEQIQALYVNNINPIHFLVKPLIIASLLATPILTLLFILVALFGGYCVGVKLLLVPAGNYFYGIQEAISLTDIFYSLCKASIFGFFITSLSAYFGYHVHLLSKDMGATAVRNVTTKSVVTTCITILAINYVLSSFFFT